MTFDAPPPPVQAISRPADPQQTQQSPPPRMVTTQETSEGPIGQPGERAPADASSAQDTPDSSGAADAAFGSLANFYRLDEDYRSVRDLPRTGFPLALKEMPVAPDLWLSLGGDYRFRVDSYDNPGFGKPRTESFTAIENRFLLHADLELGDTVRAFVQLGAGTEGGRRPGPIPGERSAPDLVQGFVEIRHAAAGGLVKLRVGRQEFVLGKLFTIRESINFRQAFDGVRFDAFAAGWNLIGFAGRPVVNRTAAFDDATSHTDRVATVSLDHAVVSGLRLQGTFVTRQNDRASYAQGNGGETRRSYTVRLFGNTGPVSVDAQAIYQEGSFLGVDGQHADISAWGIALQAELNLPGPLSPRAGMRVDSASGDANQNDRRLGTLDIPYPGLSYLNDATIFGPRNSRDLQPYFTVKPRKTVTLTFGDEVLWRNQRGDAVYSPANVQIAPPGVGGSLIANQPYVRAEWRMSPILTYQFSYVHVSRGEVLKESGTTSNLDFFTGSLLFRF